MGLTGIFQRRTEICPSLDGWSPDEIVVTCSDCEDFFLFCCSCSRNPERPTCCHAYRVVYTDGACLDNGRSTARAGAGFAAGLGEDCKGCIPITEENDNSAVRSNQRAELFAAIQGLSFLDASADLNDSSREPREDYGFVVATDSEYVVKGITEWFPSWRVRFPSTFS